jgi:hypothetical protein
MDEVFPVLSGVVLGFIIARMQAGTLRNAVLMVASLALGFLAAWISGELAVSPWYVLVDVAQVLVAAILIAVLVKRWQSRAKRTT